MEDREVMKMTRVIACLLPWSHLKANIPDIVGNALLCLAALLTIAWLVWRPAYTQREEVTPADFAIAMFYPGPDNFEVADDPNWPCLDLGMLTPHLSLNKRCRYFVTTDESGHRAFSFSRK